MGKKGGNYYAVQNGRETGVYSTWEQAESRVSGYSNNAHQKFSSQDAAWDYAQPSGKGSYYAVQSGTKPGVYSSWSDASEQVTGVSGSVHKKFDTYDAASQYAKGGK